MLPEMTLPAIAPTLAALRSVLDQGGAAIHVIAALSVVTLAVILWKLWRFARIGAWSTRRSARAVDAWTRNRPDAAEAAVAASAGVRDRVVSAALAAVARPGMTEDHAREETARVARRELARLRAGFRALELVATIAPLIGLLGTVLGMIAAFQALQAAGARADPATLAGGIWEALLTTAAGMAVAIPASAALTWFESIADRVQRDMEDAATRIFTHRPAEAALTRAQAAA